MISSLFAYFWRSLLSGASKSHLTNQSLPQCSNADSEISIGIRKRIRSATAQYDWIPIQQSSLGVDIRRLVEIQRVLFRTARHNRPGTRREDACLKVLNCCVRILVQSRFSPTSRSRMTFMKRSIIRGIKSNAKKYSRGLFRRLDGSTTQR